MRLIDADELKEKLIKIQDDIVSDIVNQKKSRGNAKSDAWKAAYLLVFDEYIKMVDEMPSATCGSNADDFLDAYGKGYSKGRVDALSEAQHIKDYCDSDCDSTKEAAVAITNYLYKHEMRKEQKMENSEMTREEAWNKVIKDLKTLDQEAHDEEFVPLVTGLLVMTTYDLRSDVANGTITYEDKFHMRSLIYDLGCYSINGETIMYLPVYQELTALLRKVL